MDWRNAFHLPAQLTHLPRTVSTASLPKLARISFPTNTTTYHVLNSTAPSNGSAVEMKDVVLTVSKPVALGADARSQSLTAEDERITLSFHSLKKEVAVMQAQTGLLSGSLVTKAPPTVDATTSAPAPVRMDLLITSCSWTSSTRRGVLASTWPCSL